MRKGGEKTVNFTLKFGGFRCRRSIIFRLSEETIPYSKTCTFETGVNICAREEVETPRSPEQQLPRRKYLIRKATGGRDSNTIATRGILTSPTARAHHTNGQTNHHWLKITESEISEA